MCECECLYVTTRAMFSSLDKNVTKKMDELLVYISLGLLWKDSILAFMQRKLFQTSFSKVLNSYVKKK